MTTCASADCAVSNYCLVCRDPRGNTATDCSQDWESLGGASSGTGQGGSFNSCSTGYGLPGGSTTSCHYPGFDTCTVLEEPNWQCIDCTYQDGSGSGTCIYVPDGEEHPKVDIFAKRPAGLPVPGTCVDTTSADGDLVCTTCTRADLSATTTCVHPEATRCDPSFDAANRLCVTCRNTDGSHRTYCEPS